MTAKSPGRGPGLLVRLAAGLVAACGLACSGSVGPSGSGTGTDSGTGGSGDDPPQACLDTAFDPGPAPIRRLTAAEYANTVRDLLDGLGAGGGLDSSTDNINVGELLAEQYIVAAEAIAATTIAEKLGSVLPCDAAQGNDACAQQFIASFGQRTFRQPLSDTQKQRFFDLFKSDPQGTFTENIELVVSAMLESPFFLYRPEVGTGENGIVKLSDFEIATRLSYLLWDTMPDDALLAAATSGGLGNPAGISSQVDRMLADPRAHARTAGFHANWLEMDGLGQILKDAGSTGGFSETIHLPLFQQETEAFLDHVTWRGEGDLTTLLTAPYTLANRDLAAYYGSSGGIPTPPAGSAFEKVTLDPGTRAGVMTQASFLTLQAGPKSDKTNTVKRGVWVRSRLLCSTPPEPPSDVDFSEPPSGMPRTTRELLEQMTSPATCNACHATFNPLGFAFENYDTVGRWRAEEFGLPIDASGTFVNLDDPALQGGFAGVPDLAHKIAQSRLVGDCYVQNWFQFGFGRGVETGDACTLARLQDSFATTGGQIQGPLKTMTQMDAFVYKTNEGVSP